MTALLAIQPSSADTGIRVVRTMSGVLLDRGAAQGGVAVLTTMLQQPSDR